MGFVDLFKDWGGHVFSICGIIGGLFMYYRHDKRIKKQEQLLNDLQIKQYKKAEDQEKQARVECSILSGNKGSRRVRFYNSGLSDARNVHIEILNEDKLEGVEGIRNWGPYELITPRNGSREERIFLCEGHTDVLQLRITWDDDFENNRSLLQSPQL